MLSQKTVSRLAVILGIVTVIMSTFAVVCAYAAGDETSAAAAATSGAIPMKEIASALAIGLAAAGGAIGMGLVGGKTVESIARQPEVESKIRTNFMLTLVFIETAIIYALLVVILIIFVI